MMRLYTGFDAQQRRFHIGWIGLLVMVSVAAMWRFGQQSGYFPLAEWSLFGAVSLFGAAYFRSTTQAYLFPLFALLVSDIWLAQTVYAEYSTLGFLYRGWWWTYLAFCVNGALG